MNNFPIDFTPYCVLKAKRAANERRLREKIEEEKRILRARIVERVTKGCEERWWWEISVENKNRWEHTTFLELQNDLTQKGWLLGHFPLYETIIICTRMPTNEEIEGFFRVGK